MNNFTPSITNLTIFNTVPNIWLPTDAMAKSMYSAVMTDLGQTTGPIILLNATALQFYTVNMTYLTTHIANAIPGPAKESYSALANQTGPLETSPSVILTKYFCQIPIRKSTGSLILSILIADLVFLQALWQIFNFIINQMLIRKNLEG